jgi:hypothetical protein
VVLYSNGVAIATNLTDSEGWYYFSNLGDAIYSVAVDTNDAAFPAGLMQTFDPDGALDSFATNIVVSGGSVVSVGGVSCTDCDLSIDFGYRYAGNNSLSGTIGLDAQPYDGLMNGMNHQRGGGGRIALSERQVYLYLWNDDGDGIIESGEYVLISSTFTDSQRRLSVHGPAQRRRRRPVHRLEHRAGGLPEADDHQRLDPGVTVTETVNAQGNTVSAYLVVDIIQDTDIYNMDFAYRSTVDYDYGDLPQSYQTLGPDGARHIVPAVPNLFLGATVDTEPNGLPSPGPTATIWTEATTRTGWMVISMAVSSTGGNGSGVYTNVFTVDPQGVFDASSTPLYARFRLFPSQPLFPSLAYAGTADNGEVEDYLWHLAGIGDYVWSDVNGDGIQDAGEPPMAGVRVFADLNDDGIWQAGEPVSITDENGLYSLGGLIPGTYSVRVDESTLPTGAQPSYDLDGIETPHVASVAINQLDQFVSTADFGYVPPASIGKRVWFDENRDGIQNANETNGIPNIPVLLLDKGGTIVAETTTSMDGYYLFAGVPAGTYRVQFDLTSVSTNEMMSPSKVGGDDEIDSDAIAGTTASYAWTDEFSVSGGQELMTVDLGITTRTPTRTELGGVWGEWAEGRARVAWRTESEFSTAGFLVSRVDPETLAETRLGGRLLPSSFQESGAVYRVDDPEAGGEGGEGLYRMVEVELSGQFHDLGIHAVRFDAPAPEAKASRVPAKTLPVMKVARRIGPESSPVLKVHVREEGIHGIALTAIAAGMGRSLEDVEALAQAGSLRIARQGMAVPVWHDAARGRLLFHAAAPVRNWYAHADAYLISVGEGRAMVRREPGATAGESVFPVTLHFEENRFLFNMTRMPADFYFWEGVVSGADDQLSPRLPLDLSGHAGGDVQIKVRLMGWSSTTNDPDHHAEFHFNGQLAGEIAFDGQEVAEAVFTVPAAAVSNGLNTLMVHGRMAPDQSHSFFVVDWVEATLDRHLAPLPVPAHIRPGGASAVSAQAFAEPLAIALDEAGNVPFGLPMTTGPCPPKPGRLRLRRRAVRGGRDPCRGDAGAGACRRRGLVHGGGQRHRLSGGGLARPGARRAGARGLPGGAGVARRPGGVRRCLRPGGRGRAHAGGDSRPAAPSRGNMGCVAPYGGAGGERPLRLSGRNLRRSQPSAASAGPDSGGRLRLGRTSGGSRRGRPAGHGHRPPAGADRGGPVRHDRQDQGLRIRVWFGMAEPAGPGGRQCRRGGRFHRRQCAVGQHGRAALFGGRTHRTGRDTGRSSAHQSAEPGSGTGPDSSTTSATAPSRAWRLNSCCGIPMWRPWQMPNARRSR